MHLGVKGSDGLIGDVDVQVVLLTWLAHLVVTVVRDRAECAYQGLPDFVLFVFFDGGINDFVYGLDIFKLHLSPQELEIGLRKVVQRHVLVIYPEALVLEVKCWGPERLHLRLELGRHWLLLLLLDHHAHQV